MSRKTINMGLKSRSDNTPPASEANTNNVIQRINKTQQAEENSIFKYRYVKLEKFTFNEKNDYPIEAIEEMGNSLLFNGLQHNLVAKYDIDTDTYKILSGERRTRALQHLKKLYEEGQSEEWNTIYQKNIEPLLENGIPTKLDDSKDDIDEEIRLHVTNVDVRELTAAKKAAVIARLNELYRIKAERGEMAEGISNKIASDLKITDRQVRQYNAINEKLISGLKEEFDKNNITVKDGSKFAQLDEDEQQAILEMIRAGQKVGQSELAVIKKEKELVDNKVKELENSLSEKAAQLEAQQKEKEDVIKHNEELLESLKKTEESKAEQEEELRQQLESEIQAENQQAIANLQSALKELQIEKMMLTRNIDSLEKESSKKKAEIEQLQKELDKQINEPTSEKTVVALSDEEKQQLKIKYELEQLAQNVNSLLNNAEKKIAALSKEECKEDYVVLLEKLLKAR